MPTTTPEQTNKRRHDMTDAAPAHVCPKCGETLVVRFIELTKERGKDG